MASDTKIDQKVPHDYTCAFCGANGVKLWRQSHTFDPVLSCAPCLQVTVHADGTHVGKRGHRTDQLRGHVPAVPCDGGFWGYTSVPPEGVAWWRSLPVHIEVPA